MPIKDGDNCPECEKGTLHPTGKTEDVENPDVESGEHHRRIAYFECEDCGATVKGAEIGLRESINFDENIDAEEK